MKPPKQKKKARPLALVVPIHAAKGAKKNGASRAASLGVLASPELLAAMREMAVVVSTAPNPSEARKAQLSIIHQLLRAKACFIAEHLPDRDKLQIASARGRADAEVRVGAPGEGTLGRAFSTAEVVREGKLLAAPLFGEKGVQGVLGVLGARMAVSDEVALLLAGQVAAASDLARLRDVSARHSKDLQTAIAGLKSLEKNREEMMFNVSHELKNPLTTIKAYLAMLAREKLGEVSERQQEALQNCDRNADRLLRLIDDLLLISRLQSGQMELSSRPFGLKAVVEEVLHALAPVAEQNKVEIRLAPSPEVYVRGDRERLVEAIYNLFDHILYRSTGDRPVEVKVQGDESGLAHLSIADQGPGMSQEELSHLFDSYYKARAKRSSRDRSEGFGLAIAAKIVQLHNGRIDATSRPGGGTSFQVFLPMFAGTVGPVEVTDAPKAGGILLVEDDRDCREVLQQLLEEEGYRVIPASSASEAKAVLENIRPALALLDLRLSDEDGRAVLRFIRAHEALSEVPVYIISGATELAQLAQGQGLDRIDGYFEKPLQLPRLLETVAAVVRPAQSGRPGLPA